MTVMLLSLIFIPLVHLLEGNLLILSHVHMAFMHSLLSLPLEKGKEGFTGCL